MMKGMKSCTDVGRVGGRGSKDREMQKLSVSDTTENLAVLTSNMK